MPEIRYDLSLVLPVYNEAESIKAVHEELVGVLQQMELSYEIIYVDDGSHDESPFLLQEISATSDSTKAVFLRRNFGQTAAIQAGIDQSSGAVIAFMDSDLQNDPAELPRMYACMQEGLDLVSGWRKDRKDNLVRKIPSVIANQLISLVTSVRLHDYGCTQKMYRREVLDHVRLYGEMHRFIPVLAHAAGAKINEIEVNHRARKYGTSKYTLWRTLKVILDLMTVTFLTKYNTRPMYIFGGTGFLFGLVGMMSLLASLFYNLLGNPTSAATMGLIVMGTVLIMGSLQTILMGLLIEMLMRTYYESQHKGPYTIREVSVNGSQHSI